MNQNYFIRYKLASGDFRVYNNATGEITTEHVAPVKYDFFVQKGYDATDEGLMEYVKEFKRCAVELYENKIYPIHYTKYNKHYTAVLFTFSNISKKKYVNHEEISNLESTWMEACPNGSLQYCEPQTCESYAYDFSEMYPGILTNPNFIIPTKAGKEKTLKKLPSTLETGYYRVKISCENKNFKKLFSFSQHHTYTNVSLNYAQTLQKEYDVKINLIQDDKPNAYIYESITKGSSIFSYWFYKMLALKKAFPKNMLVKHLFSSLWGTLVSFNKMNITYDEIQERGLKVGMGSDCDYIIKEYHQYENQEYYEVVDTNKPYKYNIRIKAFLSACARNKTAEVARLHIDDVIRIHTDCIVFNKPHNMSIPHLVNEDKTTGLIRWVNVNSYYKRCVCGKFFHNTDRKNHKKCTKNLSKELEYLNSLHKDQKSILSQINKNVDILNNMN
jgi:hypothetical protein